MHLKLFFLYILIFFFSAEFAYSQDSFKPLLSIEESEIPVSAYLDFLKLNDPDHTKSVKENSNGFIDYQLKLYEAKQLGCDSGKLYREDIAQFREIMAADYLEYDHLDENTVKKYYSRILRELDLNHIQVNITGDFYSDTLSAFRKIDSIYSLIMQGEDFNKLAFAYSDGPTAGDHGYFGYFTGMERPFPLEELAFSTPIGEVSNIMRTSTAYHIVKVNQQKETKGSIKVDRISKKGGLEYPDDHNEKVLLELDSLRERIISGEDFISLARQYSDIRQTEERELDLPWIRSGGHSRIFVDAAFSLKYDGDISPVVSTPEGYYLIKRIAFKPLPKLEEARREIIQYYDESTSRQNYLRDNFVRDIMVSFGFSFHQDAYDRFVDYGKHAFHEGEWIEPADLDKECVIFTIGEKDISYLDFSRYLEKQQFAYSFINYPPVVGNQFQKFFLKVLRAYKNQHLEERYPDFKTTLENYSNALLINCIEDRIWDKALLDTSGLNKFYLKNQKQYDVTGFDGLIIRFSDVKAKQKLEFEINNSLLDLDELTNKLQNNHSDQVKMERVLVKKGENTVIDHFIWKQSRFESDYTLIMVKGNMAKLPSENLNEVLSDVGLDYKEIAEEKWLRELHKKYKIKLNRKVLKGSLQWM